MTMTMTMMPLCHDDDCSGDGGGGERGGGGRGVGDGHPGHREDGQLQQGELAFVDVLWYEWLVAMCRDAKKQKIWLCLLSLVLNFFHGVLIGKKEKVLLTPTVGKFPYLCYISRVCACVRTCVFFFQFRVCVFMFMFL